MRSTVSLFHVTLPSPVCSGMLGVMFALGLGVTSLSAQDLEPRAFSNAPVGLNFLLAGYAFSSGNLLFDPAVAAALQIEDARGKIHQGVAGYVRTVGFLGRAGRIGAAVPVARGRWEGTVADTFATVTRAGFGDPRLFVSVALLGAPALRGREFVRYRERTVVGASLQVIAPLGQYSPDRLINLGSNRWSFKPRIGVSQSAGRWTLEAYGAAWFFTDNPDFAGMRVEQDPIYSIEAHALYSFRPGLWVAVNGGYGMGGRSTVNGDPRDDRRSDTRFGAQLALPLARRHALKFIYVTSTSTRIGADFDTASLVYQFRWGAGL